MSILADNEIEAADFIDNATKDPTPSNNAGKAVKLESTNTIHPDFITVGVVDLVAGEAIDVSTAPLAVYIDVTSTKVMKCDSQVANAEKNKFIGFAITSAAAVDDPIKIKTTGEVDGFTGLTPGLPYYLSTTGTITNDPSSYNGIGSMFVGLALNSTTLLIEKGLKTFSQTVDWTAAGSKTFTCGFKPALVKIYTLSQEVKSSNSSVSDIQTERVAGVFTREGLSTYPNIGLGASPALDGESRTMLRWDWGSSGNDTQSDLPTAPYYETRTYALTAMTETDFTINGAGTTSTGDVTTANIMAYGTF